MTENRNVTPVYNEEKYISQLFLSNFNFETIHYLKMVPLIIDKIINELKKATTEIVL